MSASLYETYQRFLPLIRDPKAADRGQGRTSLVRSRTIGPSLGLDQLWFKLELSNPSGSYKDRFAGLALAMAREAGAKACIATSSGNTGAAVAAFAAAFGMPAYLFINERTPTGKLSQMRAYGARLVRVRGMGIDPQETSAILQSLKQEGAARGFPFLVSAFAISPDGMAGIKTIAYEIAESGPVGHIFCPVGSGGLYCAIARGFLDLASEGSPLPRLHPVQPVLNDTIVTPLNEGAAHARCVDTTTGISGLAVPFDLDGTLSIELARSVGGQGVLIDDEDAFAAQHRLMREEGILVEPAGAVAVAGLLRAAKERRFTSGEKIVCVLTGHGFKDPGSIEAASSGNEIDLIDRKDIGGLFY
ncbi:pyridoxal-phosphate dependent enzyme [Novosphingobium mathurense]|uniref:Threonine synthase n=1 Tax=Novosphingobium mathurense TaxID=428990 RepID=A0A1U6ILD6_9SPHN|nr:pyridoxal-phosphate dependent enzyme [Novosphingobium mathurense]SLK08772.1 threonine synthase [Novosphingobium mathurense]